ncbi:macrophage mannose receptor 1-like [Siniperca chuatsi]|uniref:macrophage mannose receptor 1-like n=1 Tax=Siniperca chuatsi TaxID=119488 RepID=UPI001CE107E3|nr:macrophage mannose receptor 1-like [Siniperca chuatsi]
MGNKNSPELTLSFLLMAALCLEASITETIIYYPAEKMNWTEARLFCQKKHTDLVTWDLERFWQDEWLEEVWIGLLRDPEKDSVWKWINLKSGEGVSGDDVSQSSNWADGQQSSYCAVVTDDLMWNSTNCSSTYYFHCSVGNTMQYHKSNLNWYHASQYCQNKTSELATITETNTNSLKKSGWIGLYRKAGKTWSWIGDSASEYRNWAPGQPLTADCASFDPVTKKWHSNACSKELQLACYDDNLVMVNENKTWEDALRHCRDMETPCVDSLRPCIYHHQLLSLQDLSDYGYVRDRLYRATTDEVWTGLRFVGGEWWWVNGQKPEDQGMLPDCPSKWKHCGTMSKYNTDNWIIRDCSERRNFICHRRKILIAVMNDTGYKSKAMSSLLKKLEQPTLGSR